MKKIVFLDFSKNYKELFYYVKSHKYDAEIIAMDDISGTNGYCDDMALKEIRKRIESFSYDGIRFIDSGNYHYLSLLWMENIKEDFALVLFDYHSDTQEPAFGDILSCGSWVKAAMERNKHLKKVYFIGVSDKKEEEISGELPLYISIDKDVMSSDYAACDWDQGQMSLAELEERMRSIIKNNKILGIDICGDKKHPSEAELELNNKTNKSLLALIENSFDS